ncbi:MAG: aldehyde dehydrogenase, partial [Chloroflexaceae bacterium]|nr:aldehyde dehydrogenase [Chloroflexaceae bacterium]
SCANPNRVVVDFTVQLNKGTTVDEVNAALKQASEGPMKGILAVEEKPLVSTDFLGNAHSSIVDAELTISMGEDFFKVVSWYDNEWGYSVRIADVTAMLAAKL